MKWKSSTCEHCAYRVFNSCLRFPPQGEGFPIVERTLINKKKDVSHMYNLACGEYKDKDLSDE